MSQVPNYHIHEDLKLGPGHVWHGEGTPVEGSTHLHLPPPEASVPRLASGGPTSAGGGPG